MRVSWVSNASFDGVSKASFCAPPPFSRAHLEEAKAPGSSIFYWFRLTGGARVTVWSKSTKNRLAHALYRTMESFYC